MSLITTFENQCRALAGTASPDENASRFLVGTLSPRTENTINLFEYRDDNNNLAKVSFRFPDGELWHLSTPSKYPRLFAAVVGQGNQLGISVFKLPRECESSLEDDFGLLEDPIEKSFDVVRGGKNLTRQSHWHPDDKSELLICNDRSLEFWNVETHDKIRNFSLDSSIERSVPEGTKVPQVIDLRWSSLFNCSVVAAAVGSRTFGIDTRVPDSNLSSICWLIEDKKCNRVRSIDFNPNSQYYVASGGDDCQAKFWDLRQTSKPVLQLQPHTHWVWGIRYNPFHDQLVLTAGGDARVSLIRAQSMASEPYGRLGEDCDSDESQSDIEDEESHTSNVEKKDHSSDGLDRAVEQEVDCDLNGVDSSIAAKQSETTKNLNDEIVKIYEEHDDSVYAIEWATDPWVFASLGFESRLVINKVPRTEKLNILF